MDDGKSSHTHRVQYLMLQYEEIKRMYVGLKFLGFGRFKNSKVDVLNL